MSDYRVLSRPIDPRRLYRITAFPGDQPYEVDRTRYMFYGWSIGDTFRFLGHYRTVETKNYFLAKRTLVFCKDTFSQLMLPPCRFRVVRQEVTCYCDKLYNFPHRYNPEECPVHVTSR